MSVWRLTAIGGPAEIDLPELRRALAVLPDPSAGVEFRAKVPRQGGRPAVPSRVAPGGDEAAMLAAVSEVAAGADLVWWCTNPVPPDLRGQPHEADVLRRRWLLVDVDPARDPAHKDGNATDGEKRAARALAQRVRDALDGRGWPLPVAVDSGNGVQLLYRLDEPNDAPTHALVKATLHGLAREFDGPDGKIGRECHNAARLAKLPGTWATKGPPSDDRPRRPVRLLSVPDEVEPVPRALLSVPAGAGGPGDRPPPPQPAAPPGPWTLRAAQGPGAAAYARKCLDKACQAVRLEPPGGRRNRLVKEGYGMGGFVGSGLLLAQEVEARLYHAAEDAGLVADANCGRESVLTAIRDGIRDGGAAPRVVPGANGVPHGDPQAGTPAAAAVPAGESVIVRGNAIRTRKVEWLWPGRIPLGKLTTFAGLGGLGKTFTLCDITARVTRGLPWPDSAEGECPEPGDVLFISGEDEADDTLVPRMIEMSADMARVAFLKTEVLDRFTLADLETLDRALRDMGPSTRFVAIDPPTAYLGDVNDHKNAELRGLLGPLQRWAARHRLAVVFNTHVTKPQAARVEAMMRVMGSVAWVNAVRAAHMFAADPDDDERTFFIPMKSNLSRRRKGMAYKIVVLPNELARIEWLGEVDTTADEAMARVSKPRSVVASDWLKERFAEKREWPSDDLFRAAKAAGVSRDAVFEAKHKLNLPKARKVTHENGNTEWVWWVPEGWPNPLCPQMPQFDTCETTPFDEPG
jgi:hypothetical protein